jgi:hypothetical protein
MDLLPASILIDVRFRVIQCFVRQKVHNELVRRIERSCSGPTQELSRSVAPVN